MSDPLFVDIAATDAAVVDLRGVAAGLESVPFGTGGPFVGSDALSGAVAMLTDAYDAVAVVEAAIKDSVTLIAKAVDLGVLATKAADRTDGWPDRRLRGPMLTAASLTSAAEVLRDAARSIDARSERVGANTTTATRCVGGPVVTTESWWNALTAAQRVALIRFRPGLVSTTFRLFLTDGEMELLATDGRNAPHAIGDHDDLRQRMTPQNLWSDQSEVGPYMLHGTIVGPDGRPYQVVMPSVNFPGGVKAYDFRDPSVDNVFNIDGADPGWRTVNVETGMGSYGQSVPGWEAGLIVVSAATGGPSTIPGMPAEAEAYERLTFDPLTGEAVLGDADEVATVDRPAPGGGAAVPQPTVMVLVPTEKGASGYYQHVEIGRDPHGAPNPLGRVVMPVVSTVAGSATGIDAVQSLNDADTFAYQIVYQENPETGLTRAIVSGAQLSETNGSLVLTQGRGGVRMVNGQPHLVGVDVATENNTRNDPESE